MFTTYILLTSMLQQIMMHVFLLLFMHGVSRWEASWVSLGRMKPGGETDVLDCEID